MMRLEEKLHIAICDYLKLQYPDILFISEPSGVRVSIGLAFKLKKMRSAHTHLDLYILEPRQGYHGLIIELKAVNIYKENGDLRGDKHLQDQKETIEKLRKRGYKSTFAVGFDQAKEVIDNYLNSK